ncbi:MAG TPA: O-antigen ligase family protein [Gaiellaceae bacterium]|nr:O-antigen ligase family protein [Gaiellaceae bacterium]
MSSSVLELRAERSGAAVGRRERSLAWAWSVSALVLVVWLVPIKSYRLPVQLPFSLELYRLLMLVLLAVLAYGVVGGTRRVSAAGFAKPVLLLVAAGTLSQLVNAHASSQGTAMKALPYFLSFVVAYLLVCSTIDSFRAIELVLQALVLGGVVVAVAAVYESRTSYDVFDHLHRWFSFLVPTRVSTDVQRGARLRVRASAQHPIALGAALTLAVPLAAYFAGRAATRLRALAWGAAGAILVVGAFATVSRTVVLMAVAMVAAALVVRGRAVRRYWPVAAAVVVAAHIAAPGALGSLYHSFVPRAGLIQSQTVNSGNVGSGRLADIAPGLQSWERAPFFGHGLDSVSSTASSTPGAIIDPATGAPIIFDDQYLNSLVAIGFVGLVAVIWLVWGAAWELAGTARRVRRREGDLVAACAVSCVGFAAGMLTFDAFAFVQCTLLFFVIAALGLRARTLLA